MPSTCCRVPTAAAKWVTSPASTPRKNSAPTTSSPCTSATTSKFSKAPSSPKPSAEAPSSLFGCCVFPQQRIVQIHYVPVPLRSPAHGHPVPHYVFFRSRDLILVGVPQRIPKALHVLHRHSVAKIRSVFHVARPQIFHRLLAPPIFAVRRVQDNLRIEALFQFLGVSLLK